MKTICKGLDVKHIFLSCLHIPGKWKAEGVALLPESMYCKTHQRSRPGMGQAGTISSFSVQFFPCQSSRESPFVLMFSYKWTHYGNSVVTAENIRRAREKQPWQEATSKLKVGDLVFVCDPDSGVFKPCYSPNYQIIAIHGSNRIEVQDKKGHKSLRRTGHVKKVEPVDKVCYQLLPEEVYKQFERASKLLIHPKDVPNIKMFTS